MNATEKQKEKVKVEIAPNEARLEKYLRIYSSRIQTLSSIIGSYQKHFKLLEDKLRVATEGRETKNLAGDTARVEALKRMITLKDTLIKQ